MAGKPLWRLSDRYHMIWKNLGNGYANPEIYVIVQLQAGIC